MKKYFTIRNVVIAAITAGALSAGSCKKEGINHNLNAGDQDSVDFMSTKAGTYWKYGSRDGVQYTRYARGHDTIKNGKQFSYYERSDSGGNFIPEYFGKNGSLYITLIDLDGSKSRYLDYVFWKDSSRLNEQWTNIGEVNDPTFGKIAVQIESKEVENNQTLSWNGKTFRNVVHVHSDGKVTALNLKVATFDFWFVKGLGIVRQETNVDIPGLYSINHTDSLIEWNIQL